MKRLIKSLLFVTLFIAFSCKKDEEPIEPIEVTPSNFTTDVSENPAIGDVLGTLEVVTNSKSSSSYNIVSQSVDGALSIDATGKLTVADETAFNYELNETITATIEVENSGVSATTSVSINVLDVQELFAENLSITIDENPDEGAIGSITKTYDDVLPLTFSIINQTPASALLIDDESGLMEIADASLFDFETNPVITAEVGVTNGFETVIVDVTITLNDVDELTVTVENFTKNVVENSVSHDDILGTLDITVTGETVALSYDISILGEDPTGAIEVNNNGEIMVQGEEYFNYELYPVIEAEVQVSIDGVSATATITINLNDDPTETAQQRLDEGETPMQLYYSGVIITDILGTDYAGGILATLDTNTGIALILGAESSTTYTYSAAVTAVGSLTDNGYTDWEIPIKDQMDAICTTLSSIPNAFPVSSGDLWTNTTCGASCRYTYQIGSHGCGSGGTPTSATVYLTPVRLYEDPNVEQ